MILNLRQTPSVIFFSLVLLVSGSAWSGVRIIANGGGMGEMLALAALAEIPKILSLAEHFPKDGLSTPAEQALLMALIRQVQKAPIENTLGFFTDLSSDDSDDKVRYTLENPLLIQISSRALYTPNQQAMTIGEIYQIVFSAWANQPRVRQSLVNSSDGQQREVGFAIDSLGRKIFGNLKTEGLVLYLGLSLVRFHALNWSNDHLDQSRSLLALESETKSYDLTQRLLKKLICQGNTPASLVQIDNLVLDENTLIINLRWRCGKNNSSGLLSLSIPENFTSQADPQRLVFSAPFRVMTLPSHCEGGLINPQIEGP